MSIATVLDALRAKLDENNQLDVYDPSGTFPKVGFNFHKPTPKTELDLIITKNQLNLPAEYQDFLLLHNGAEFFTYEYGYAFCLYSIEEMLCEFESMKNYCDLEYVLKNCYPIGYVVDMGTILLDHSKGNILLSGITITNFYCDLTTWLNRMFMAQGHAYWDWYSNEVNL